MKSEFKLRSFFYLFLMQTMLFLDFIKNLKEEDENIYGITILVFLEDIKVIPSSDGHPLPETHKITIRVITSSLGNNYHYGDHVETRQFAFTAPEAGDYIACFWFMEMKLKKLEDVVRYVHDEMIYLRERKEEMEGISRATSSKTAWLVFCSRFVFSSVAGLQLRHLKNFFEMKKSKKQHFRPQFYQTSLRLRYAEDMIEEKLYFEILS
ncbi:hypothetical protein MKX03_009544 [Papaver bracteatum]|nr:hypothetical protein MKX03_009544 [Papaver bracteatum]